MSNVNRNRLLSALFLETGITICVALIWQHYCKKKNWQFKRFFCFTYISPFMSLLHFTYWLALALTCGCSFFLSWHHFVQCSQSPSQTELQITERKTRSSKQFIRRPDLNIMQFVMCIMELKYVKEHMHHAPIKRMRQILKLFSFFSLQFLLVAFLMLKFCSGVQTGMHILRTVFWSGLLSNNVRAKYLQKENISFFFIFLQVGNVSSRIWTLNRARDQRKLFSFYKKSSKPLVQFAVNIFIPLLGVSIIMIVNIQEIEKFVVLLFSKKWSNLRKLKLSLLIATLRMELCYKTGGESTIR